VAEFTLIAEPPLARIERTFGQTRLWAPADLAIVSVALPLGQEEAARKAMSSAFGTDLPEQGRFATAEEATWLTAMSPDQAFVIFPHHGTDAEHVVQQRLNGKAYTTNQSDAWVALCINGPEARIALERICPIDLSPNTFTTGSAARTFMEHLGVLILRTGETQYHLFSASSSADSFLHAVETSLRNVI